MTFPVYLSIGPWRVHPHLFFETLSYFIAARIYFWQRARTGDTLGYAQRMTIIAAAILGAAAGSKILFWFVDPGLTLKNWHHPAYLISGKTIVGALAGGLLAVEWMKRRIGVTRPTGDLFAIPLAAGIAIGRIGCFLTGLSDHTFGLPTQLPLGVDFGDGILRHPVQIYEILFMIALTIWLWRLGRKPHREGELFKAFMVAYMGFRLVVDFLKPAVPFLGLTAIQWVCVAVLVYYRRDIPQLFYGQEANRS